MCGSCPPIAPGTEDEVVKQCRIDIKLMEDSLQRMFLESNAFEDNYRSAGILYHCTQLSARTPHAGMASEQLDRLKDMFEISSVEEYNAIFKEMNDKLKVATELRSRSCRYFGTANQLLHHVSKELKPGLLGLIEAFLPLVDDFTECFMYAETLYNISYTSHEINSSGRRIAWHDAYGPMSAPVPIVLGHEWKIYSAWSYSLPETQRAVAAGRIAEDVILELLYSEPDGFVEYDDDFDFSRRHAAATPPPNMIILGSSSPAHAVATPSPNIFGSYRARQASIETVIED